MITLKAVGGGGGGGKAASVSGNYFSQAFEGKSLAQSDNYYINEKASATWEGGGAKILGIEGKDADRKEYVDLLMGKVTSPKTGEIQDLGKGQPNRRLGYDLSISPPKSVSVVALVAGDHRVIDAHLKSNKEAMAYLEQYSAIARVTENGKAEAINTGNLLYTSVLHHTNRLEEPQLHSHNVVHALTYDKTSESWRSLTNDKLVRSRMKADKVYVDTLAQELGKLGYKLEFSDKSFEIAGFTKDQLKEFSKRSDQRDAKLKEWGIKPEEATYEQRQNAVLATRNAKDEKSHDVLEKSWREQAASLNIDFSKIVPNFVEIQNRSADKSQEAQNVERTPSDQPSGKTVLPSDPNEKTIVLPQEKIPDNSVVQPSNTSSPERELSKPEKAQVNDDGTSKPSQQTSSNAVAALNHPNDSNSMASVEAVKWAVMHLNEREQAFSRQDLVDQAMRFGKGSDATRSGIEQHISEQVNRGLLIQRTVSGEQILTTHEARAHEEKVINFVSAGKDVGHTVINSVAEFDTLLKGFETKKSSEVGFEFKLTGEQVNAAKNMLMHHDSVQGIQGDAGTGKTAALEFVRYAAESKGWDVKGMATSASATKELEHSSGIKSETVAMFQIRNQRELTRLERDITDLKNAINRNGKLDKSGAQRIDQIKLPSLDEGRATYTFDQKYGEVYRTPDSVRNKIAQTLRSFRSTDSVKTQSVDSAIGRILNAGEQYVRNAAANVGESLIQYEKLDTPQAIQAKAALGVEQMNANPKLAKALKAKETELINLKNTGNTQGRPTLLVMDETSLTGVADLGKVGAFAHSIGARMVLQGDIKQHGSVASGRGFWLAQEAGMNTSRLTETRRFDKAADKTKKSIDLMSAKRFSAALKALDGKTIDDQESLPQTVAEKYVEFAKTLQSKGIDNPLIGVVALTNKDRKEINEAIHSALVKEGMLSDQGISKSHLDQTKVTDAEKHHAKMMMAKKVDTFVFHKAIDSLGVKKGDVARVLSFNSANNLVELELPNKERIIVNPQKHNDFTPYTTEQRMYAAGSHIVARSNIDTKTKNEQGKLVNLKVSNGTKGRIVAIDDNGAKVEWDDAGKKVVTQLDNKQLANIDHSYARTTFKEQGATNHREIFAISQMGARIIDQLSTYVAITRAKGVTYRISTEKSLKVATRNAQQLNEKSTSLEKGQITALAGMREQHYKMNRPVNQTMRQNDKTIEQKKQKTNERSITR